MSITDIARSITSQFMNQNSRDIKEYVEVLQVILENHEHSQELLDLMWSAQKPGWDVVWKYLKDLGITFHRYTAVHDLLGWYLKVETLGPTGFEVTEIREGPWKTKEEALREVKDETRYHIYKYENFRL